MTEGARKLWVFWGVGALMAILVGWWIVFFLGQDVLLARRMRDAGADLTTEQVAMLRTAVRESSRMFLFEGAFLVLLLIVGLGLMLRSVRSELRGARQQRNFMSAVTHELKTPITSARLYVESLQLGRVPEEKRERYLTNALDDLDRLHEMVEQVLESARMSTAGLELSLETVELTELVERRLDQLGTTIAKGVELGGSRPGPVRARADTDALRTILDNLVSNAVKYGGDPPHVDVGVAADAEAAVLTVRDRGVGLRGEDPRRLFEAFFRGGDENVRTRPGVGLGLYMVAELTKAMGGSVRAFEPGDGPGLAVEVRLPAVREGAA